MDNLANNSVAQAADLDNSVVQSGAMYNSVVHAVALDNSIVQVVALYNSIVHRMLWPIQLSGPAILYTETHQDTP